MSATPSVVFTCGCCRKPIDGDSGWLVVDLDDVMRRERAWAAHAEATGGAHSIASILELPGKVQWQAWHRDCDPDAESNAYYIDSGRITTWPQVAEWTAHLMEKRWLMATDWDDVLRGLVAGDGHLHGAAA